jgi:hypothetical protein
MMASAMPTTDAKVPLMPPTEAVAPMMASKMPVMEPRYCGPKSILIGLFVPCICFCPVDTSMDPYCGLGCVWLCGPRDPNGCCC